MIAFLTSVEETLSDELRGYENLTWFKVTQEQSGVTITFYVNDDEFIVLESVGRSLVNKIPYIDYGVFRCDAEGHKTHLTDIGFLEVRHNTLVNGLSLNKKGESAND